MPHKMRAGCADTNLMETGEYMPYMKKIVYNYITEKCTSSCLCNMPGYCKA